MQRADDFDSGGDFARRFKFAETLATCGNNLREVLVQREGADIGQECLQRGCGDASAQALDEGRVLLQGRVKRLVDRKDVLCKERLVHVALKGPSADIAPYRSLQPMLFRSNRGAPLADRPALESVRRLKRTQYVCQGESHTLPLTLHGYSGRRFTRFVSHSDSGYRGVFSTSPKGKRTSDLNATLGKGDAGI